MGLSVVNDTISRSRYGCSRPSAVRRHLDPGAFWLWGKCRQKEAVGSGSGTGTTGM